MRTIDRKGKYGLQVAYPATKIELTPAQTSFGFSFLAVLQPIKHRYFAKWLQRQIIENEVFKTLPALNRKVVRDRHA
jgi:hypothetical protein